MSDAGARLTAAGLRSLGINAQPTPKSDGRTLELGGLNSSGEECLPHKITLGDFLRIAESPDFDPAKTAFFMPTAHGPCRFGQYAPYIRKMAAEKGWDDLLILSPSSRNGYDGVNLHGADSQLIMWMALVVGDLVTRFVLKTRPYETTPGSVDDLYEETIDRFAAILETVGETPKAKLRRLVEEVIRMRDRFRALPARYVKGRPLIGLVGEIFCRQNTFSNDDMARQIEELGGECWLSDIAEWVWYANWYQETDIRRNSGLLSLDYAAAKVKTHTQHEYERTLLAPVDEDVVGYEEPPNVRELFKRARPYLPEEGCIGEMVLSVGKTIYLAEKGASGVIDISPFTCMNGVICEGVYPAVSDDHDELPIRVCYFDGVNTNISQDLEIFLDLARTYQGRSRWKRTYPAYFDEH